MKTILIINPPVYDFKLYDEWMNPLGLLLISSLLKQSGYRIIFKDYLYSRMTEKKFGTGFFKREKITVPESISFMEKDFWRFGISKEEILNELKDIRYDLALVGSFLTYWHLGSFEIIETLKRVNPEKPVWLGGVYATLCPEHAKLSRADRILQGGFTAQTICEINELLGNQKNKKTKGEICPFIDLEEVIHKPFFSVALTLGCPFKCTYCASSILQPLHQQLASPPIEILKQGYEKGIRNIAFFDDALLYDFERMKEWILNLEANGLFFLYHTPNGLHIREINEKRSVFLKQHGFKSLRFGLESLDRNMQRKSGEKASLEWIQRGVDALKKAGFSKRETGFYLLLAPDVNPCHMDKTAEILKKMDVNLHFNLYSPIPKTKDFNQLAEKFPEINNNPLLHNDSVFFKYSKLWDLNWANHFKKEIQVYNSKE